MTLDVLFARPDVVTLLHRHDEHTAVADLAGPRRPDNGFDGFVDRRVRHHHFDLHLRQQAHFVLASAIHRRVPLLPPVPAHLGDCHTGDVQLAERFLDVIDHVRTDDRLNQLHAVSFNMRSRSAFRDASSSSESLDPPRVMWNTSMAFCPSVEISTRSTSTPWSEMTRLTRCSNPGASSATSSSTVYRCECPVSKWTTGVRRTSARLVSTLLSLLFNSDVTSVSPPTTSRSRRSNSFAPCELRSKNPSPSEN